MHYQPEATRVAPGRWMVEGVETGTLGASILSFISRPPASFRWRKEVRAQFAA